MTKKTDSALSDGEFLEQSHVVDQKVEQSNLVHETDSNVQTVRMYRNTVDFLLKHLSQLHSKRAIIPNPNGVIV